MAATTNQQAGPDRRIPPMSYPRRIRTAAHLAWKTLRTGQHLEAVALLDGCRAGMDVALQMVSNELAKRGEAGAR